MLRKYYRRWMIWVAIPLVLLAVNFLLPFGLFPKLPFPNCGPEEWRWLDAHFDSKSDVIAYFQAHQLELINGSQLPELGGFSPDVNVEPLDVEIDWQALEESIRVEKRFGYTLYTLTYEHPLCKRQYHTFKVTSYGLASLYGCCGI